MPQIIDLTLTLNDGIPGVEFEQKFTVAKDGWNARTLTLYSHVGTHMDAPFHFEASNETIDEIPLSRCVGAAWVFDLGIIEPRTLITVEHLGSKAMEVQAGESVLLRTEWSRFFGQPKFRDELPRVSQGLADWCVDRKVNILGVEPPSVADVNNLEEVTQIHRTLLGGGVIIVEGLTNLARIKGLKVQFNAIPLKLKGGDGSPARAFAVID